MKNSKIEWTDHTFNPWRGCAKVSAGCANCYAETLSGRNPKTLGIWGLRGTRVVASRSIWSEPAKWNEQTAHDCRLCGEVYYAGRFDGLAECTCSGKPVFCHPRKPRVFCASLADVFEDWKEETTVLKGAPDFRDLDEARRALFCVIDETPNLDWLLLTKRPENVMRMVPDWWRNAFPNNVWMGTSVENQEMAYKRIPELLQIPAKVRFLSCEPLLGPVDLRGMNLDPGDPFFSYWPLTGEHIADGMNEPRINKGAARIHWVIAGGESGPQARPMSWGWADGLRIQCKAAGVPYLFKQWGEHDATGLKVGKKAAGRLLDGMEHNGYPTRTEGAQV